MRYPSVALAVFPLPPANALDTGRRREEEDGGAEEEVPAGRRLRRSPTTRRRSSSTRSSDVINTIFVAALLVIVVVLVFIQDWQAMLLPIIDIVVALIGTFVVMKLLGFSLNNLSLFGLVLAVGIVVDDSIVVVENIERWMGNGLSPREATHQGDGRDHRAGHRHHAGAWLRCSSRRRSCRA